MQTYTSQCKFDVNLHLKSVSLMQTYINIAPHFLEHLQTILDFFKKILVLFQTILVFSQTNDVYSANILILFKQILFSLNVFCQNMFGQSLFSINKSSTIHFLGEIFPCTCEWIWWLEGPKSLQNKWISFQDMDWHGKAQVIDYLWVGLHLLQIGLRKKKT